MYLFKVERNKVVPTIYALSHPLYKQIWNRDLLENKERAVQEYTYIEYMCSPRKSNPFFEYPEDKRHEKIVERLFPDELTFEADEVIKKCMGEYEVILHKASRTYRHYTSATKAMDKLSDFLEDVDMEARTSSNALQIKPTEISAAIGKAADAMKSLEKLKDKVDKEVYEDTKTRANREIGFFEDPANLNTKRTVSYD